MMLSTLERRQRDSFSAESKDICTLHFVKGEKKNGENEFEFNRLHPSEA